MTTYMDGGTYVPVLSSQLDKCQPLTERPESSGMVFCPQRLSHIAVMRCGQYQKKFNCHLNGGDRGPETADGRPASVSLPVPCPNAATEQQIREARKGMRILIIPHPSRLTPHVRGKGLGVRGAADLYRCRNCGGEKRSPSSKLCLDCRNASFRKNVYFSVCAGCKQKKMPNQSRRCRRCAQKIAAQVRGKMRRALFAQLAQEDRT